MKRRLFILLLIVSTIFFAITLIACDDNGEQISFVGNLAKRITVISMEEAVEKLALVHQ